MSDAETVQAEFQPSLDTIPEEVFLHICSFLDGKEIAQTLKLVCRSFYEILSNDAVWRTWLKHRWPELHTSNLFYSDDVIPNRALCILIDRGLELWSQGRHSPNKWTHDGVHISTVDAVKLIQGGQIGISGSRDRSLAVWGTSGQLSLLEHKNNAHEGWIWALDSCVETKELYSCSWDSNIKLWSLDQQLTQVSVYKCKAAALSMVCRPGLVAAGLFSPRVEIFDPRSNSLVRAYSCHTRSIMALCLVRNFIVSASEDRTIAIWDLTAGKALKSGIQVSEEGHPMTLSFTKGLLFLGDTESKMHVIDTHNDSFQWVDSVDLGHKPRGTITSMWHNPGFVMTGSKDSSVRIHTATRPPQLITKLKSSHGGVTSLDFADPVLFIGCVNNAVEMWMPY